MHFDQERLMQRCDVRMQETPPTKRMLRSMLNVPRCTEHWAELCLCECRFLMAADMSVLPSATLYKVPVPRAVFASANPADLLVSVKTAAFTFARTFLEMCTSAS